jgi:uncharacterized protein (UPF0147 family)
MAALLHDAIEDCEVPREFIAETFGQDVASLVEEVTDDKSLPKAARKDDQVKTAVTKSPRAKILKLADKVSNLRAIAASAPSNWSIKRRLEYVRWARDVAKGLRGVNQKLEEQFDDAADAAERSFKPAIGLRGAKNRLEVREPAKSGCRRTPHPAIVMLLAPLAARDARTAIIEQNSGCWRALARG